MGRVENRLRPANTVNRLRRSRLLVVHRVTVAYNELFDHLVGAGEYCRGYVKANDLCGRAIDDKLELSRKFNRQISGFLAFQNPVHVVGGAMIGFTLIDAITD